MKQLMMMVSILLLQMNYCFGQNSIDQFQSCLTNKIESGHLVDHFKNHKLELNSTVETPGELSIKNAAGTKKQTLPLLVIELIGLNGMQAQDIKKILADMVEGANYWTSACNDATKGNQKTEIQEIEIIDSIYNGYKTYLIKRSSKENFIVSFFAATPSFTR